MRAFLQSLARTTAERESGRAGREEGQWVHRTLTQVFRITSGLLCPMGHCGSASSSSIYSPNYSTNFWHCLKVCNTFHSCLCLRLRRRLRCLSAWHFAACKQSIFCYLLLCCVCGGTHTVHEYMLGHTRTGTHRHRHTHVPAVVLMIVSRRLLKLFRFVMKFACAEYAKRKRGRERGRERSRTVCGSCKNGPLNCSI